MKVVFLIGSYIPHQLVSIKELISKHRIEAYSFSISQNYTYIPEDINGLTTYLLSDYTKEEVLKKVLEIKPELVVVAGWFEKKYIWAAKQISKRLRIPVVATSDTQWKGNIRQHINRATSRWHLRKAFSHIWVAGIHQFEYARKLGFRRDQIILNSLSCDTSQFEKVSLKQKYSSYPKNLIYVGRFVKVKGLDLLIDAWNKIDDKKGWKLTLIGDGPLKEHLQQNRDIIIKDFMNHDELVLQMEHSGCFILPSTFEPWALVIHEATAAGLPIIATDVCGASPHFVINNYNGFSVKPDIKSIQTAIEKIISKDKNELLHFAENSRKLARTITPEICAAQLMSILDK
ncbi:glycosyltransferase family 4 protein [Carboxylicivirga taeanensis]|uniref:glycosyltransferase family 4 protein n=1 Tax=Carboxylicivirga taeanensis TaxID=1416875 RepID=UPI003F6DE10B